MFLILLPSNVYGHMRMGTDLGPCVTAMFCLSAPTMLCLSVPTGRFCLFQLSYVCCDCSMSGSTLDICVLCALSTLHVFCVS